MVESFTIEGIIKKGIDMLKQRDLSNPFLDAQLILSYVLGADKVYIYTYKDKLVKEDEAFKYFELINKRKQGYPLQYIVGKQEFMGIDFYVREGVLIPRPDTEILVENVLNWVDKYSNKNDIIRIVDIGTGSGAIALSLAHYIKEAIVYTVDISERALKVAEENRNKLKLEDRVVLLKGDMFEPLEDLNLKCKVDIVVSNPPYIPTDDIPFLQKEVSVYEPSTALDGGKDGLCFYRKIIPEARKYLSHGGLLAFEIGYDQGKAVENLVFNEGSFDNINIYQDLSGHDRVVTGIRI